MVSLSTLRTHTQTFTPSWVNNRRVAVRRAENTICYNERAITNPVLAGYSTTLPGLFISSQPSD